MLFTLATLCSFACKTSRTRRSCHLGGGPQRGNNYTMDGVGMTDFVNRGVINPSFRSTRGNESSDRHVRRRNGPYCRWCVQLGAQERIQQLGRFWSVPVAPHMGTVEDFLRGPCRSRCVGRAVPPLGWLVRWPDCQRQSVLLVLPPRATRTRARAFNTLNFPTQRDGQR